MEKPKKKPQKPVIRQTKTSIYRMAKANPLMVRENQIKVEDKAFALPVAVTTGRLTLDDREFLKWMQTSGNQSIDSKKENRPPVKQTQSLSTNGTTSQVQKVVPKKTTLPRQNSVPAKATATRMLQRPPLLKAKSLNADKPKPKLKESKPEKVGTSNEFKKPLAAPPKAGKLRRSISSEHFANHGTQTMKCFSSSSEHLNNSVSLKSLNMNPRKSELDSFSKFVNYRSTPLTTSTPAPKPLQDTALHRLQHPLKEWLKSRGKSLGNYQHLKCFGLQQMSEHAKDEEKENIPETMPRNSSYEDLRIPTTPQNTDQKACAENIVTGAVEDLHNLILSGYSLEQCEAWLDFIKQKSKKLEGHPQYWECRAAIEQGRGNISSAVECYKNSIINGANVNQIDESLGQLLAKFSLLNIEAQNPADAEKKRRDREEEVRNIFKSTIIQFAIKERSLNQKDDRNGVEEAKKEFTGTPVRRSTRKSCAKFQHTPGKQMFNSWSDVEKSSMKENVEFQNNPYLA